MASSSDKAASDQYVRLVSKYVREFEERIRRVMTEAFPGALACDVDAFARDNVRSNYARFKKELDSFIQKKIERVLPNVPQTSPHGWKLHQRIPLRSYNDEDEAEKHMFVTESVLFSLMMPEEASNYIIDIVENNTLRSNFVAMKHEMAAEGKDPLELLLFHRTLNRNVNSILSRNFDLSCINQPAYGDGFYFSEFPSAILGQDYSLILCRVLPGKVQTTGESFHSERFDSFQVPDGMPYEEGIPSNLHVIKRPNQILPICVIHMKECLADEENTIRQRRARQSQTIHSYLFGEPPQHDESTVSGYSRLIYILNYIWNLFSFSRTDKTAHSLSGEPPQHVEPTVSTYSRITRMLNYIWNFFRFSKNDKTASTSTPSESSEHSEHHENEPSEPSTPSALSDPIGASMPSESCEDSESSEHFKQSEPSVLSEPLVHSEPIDVSKPCESSEPYESLGASELSEPTATICPRSEYTLHCIQDFSTFDESDKAHMSAHVVLSRLLRMSRLSDHATEASMYRLFDKKPELQQQSRWPSMKQAQVMSSIVYVGNEEASDAFQSMKEQLAEDRASTKEKLLFHHTKVWCPGFFSKSEFSRSDLLKTDEFGEGFMLTDWLDLHFPHASMVMVYRVLLGRMQTKGHKLDPSTYNSFRVKRDPASTQEQYTYVVSSKYQLLPYCVAMIKNDESRRSTVSKIMEKVQTHLSFTDYSSAVVPGKDPACLVCNRTELDLVEWFGCTSACSLCADYFRRMCIGTSFFVTPLECLRSYRCENVLVCGACRLYKCIEAGMTAASLASHFDLSEVHRDGIADQLKAFEDRVNAELDKAAASTPASN